MSRYSICEGFVVLDENSEIVDWFDTFEDVESYVEEQEED